MAALARLVDCAVFEDLAGARGGVFGGSEVGEERGVFELEYDVSGFDIWVRIS